MRFQLLLERWKNWQCWPRAHVAALGQHWTTAAPVAGACVSQIPTAAHGSLFTPVS